MFVRNFTNILRLAFSAACAALAQAEDGGAARPGVPEQFRVSNWTTEQGLPQNTITALTQTRDGYVWAATRYGLARFDGIQWTAFVNELSALDNETLNVLNLAEDTGGRLWFHSQRSLTCYAAGGFKRWPLETLPFPGAIQHIWASRAGGLWVTKVGGLFHLSEGQAESVVSLRQMMGNWGENGGELEQAWEDGHGRLWVKASWASGTRSLWFRLDPKTQVVEPLAQLLELTELKDIGAVMEDRAGRLWAGRPGELLCWDGRLTRFAASTAWGDAPVKALAEDAAGTVWIVSHGAVQLHCLAAGRFTSFGQAAGIRNADDIRCLLSDRELNVWAGSGAGGLYRLQPRQLVALLTGSASTVDEIYSVASGPDGRVWLATPSGLVRFRQGDFMTFTNAAARRPDGVLSRTRMALEDHTGVVWCGLDSGLATLQTNVFAQVATPSLEGRRRVTSLLEDRQGTLWLGTPSGLLERREGEFRLWTTNDGLSAPGVFGLAEGNDGSLWVGTEHGGVNQFKDGQFQAFTPRNGLLDDNAWPLRAEADGTVWVGTPRGLNRIRGGEIRSVTMSQGLYDNLAYCLLEDRQGRYWSFCNRGIWRMRKADLNAVADGRQALLTCVSYGESDGMASTEGNGDQQPNAAALPNGELWFPTTRGVVRLDPANMRDNQVPPGVVIEEVRADEEVVFKDGGLCGGGTGSGTGVSPVSFGSPRRDARATTNAPLRLPPGRARVLQIRYTANTFVDSDLARFRYRLEGHETVWQEVRQRRVAIYTNLRPGAYRFVVEACNSHGYWSAQTATFAFSLAPQFYQTWAFRGLCAGGVVALAGGWESRRRRARQRRQREAMQSAVLEERSRIARDLHDDLGASLTGMALQVDAAQELPAPEVFRARQQALAISLRAAVGRMREAIWTVDPACDTLESFCTYLSQHAETFLGSAGLRCRLDIPAILPPHALAPEARYHLFLIAKEALNNAVKHAHASEVRVGVKLAGASVILSVEDNGRGLAGATRSARVAGVVAKAEPTSAPPQLVGSGRGVRNMRQRVAALGGEFELSSSAATGTRVRVRLPLGEAK